MRQKFRYKIQLIIVVYIYTAVKFHKYLFKDSINIILQLIIKINIYIYNEHATIYIVVCYI